MRHVHTVVPDRCTVATSSPRCRHAVVQPGGRRPAAPADTSTTLASSSSDAPVFTFSTDSLTASPSSCAPVTL
jgi:hypothetical protein